MLRTNLSTRPFYNERAVHLLIGLAALLVIALTAWNVARVLALSEQNTELATRVSGAHAEAEQLSRMAADIRRRINEPELRQVVHAAREANTLIDQRTFSWTAFFNRLEATMPPDIMLTSVRPTIKDGVTQVSMVVLARRAEDVDEFIEKLEATGAFEDAVPSTRDSTEDGLVRVVINSIYTGQEPPSETETAPKDAAAPATPPDRTEPGR